MTFVGTWQNQYGSVLQITADADNKIVGRFRTALADSAFYGHDAPVSGIHQGDCISFAYGAATENGDAIASFTGRLCDGKIETVWYVVTGDRHWPHAVLANADTFERTN